MEQACTETFLGELEKLRYQRSKIDTTEIGFDPQSFKISYTENYPHVSPLYGYLKVIRSCNSRCIYCDHWKLHDENDPSTAELKQVLQALAGLGVQHINLTGGECLLRRDLPELINFAHQYELVVCLLTNGLLLTKMSHSLLEAKIDAVIVSIDSVIPKEFEYTRGVPFDLVEKGLQALVELKQKRPEMFISITSVITRVNLDSLAELVEYTTQYGIGIQFSPYHHFDPGLPDDLTPKDPISVSRIIERLLQMKSAGYKLLDSPRFLEHFPKFFERRSVPEGFKCMAGYVAVFVDADLNVRPCWMMKPVGNLRNEELSTIWYSAGFKEARQRIKALQCPQCWLLCTAEPSFYLENGG